MPMVFRMLRGDEVNFGLQKNEEQNVMLVVADCSNPVYSVSPGSYLSFPEKSIALVTLSGPMIKRGGMCSYGMVDYTMLIDKLAANPNVSGILISIDSPGGQANGTQSLTNAIRSASGKKPVIAFVDDGMAASAAMWIASGASELYATTSTDQFGSIGAYSTIADFAAHYRDYYKLPIQEVYAPQSTEKNKTYRDAIAGDVSGIEKELEYLVDNFHNTIATNRAGRIRGEEWKTGKLFNAAEAKSIGLIDGIKSFTEIVERMQSLVKKANKATNNKTMAFEKTLAAANATEFEVVDGGFLLSEENLNSIEETIANAETAVQEATAATEQANARISELEGQVEAQTQTIADRDARISELTEQVSNLQGSKTRTGTVVQAVTHMEKTDAGAETPSYLRDDNPANEWADKKLRRTTKP